MFRSLIKARSVAIGLASKIQGEKTTQLTSTSYKANFSSRVRRRRPVSARVTDVLNDDKDGVESQRKRTEFQVNDMLESTATGIFIPTNEKGEEVSMGEYLKFATLSPWVPCPDAVARRALDIVKAGEDDIHYELGSGDGRVNFFAVDLYKVKKSVGIDIDPTMIEQSNQRILKRHPAPQNIHFLCADLVDESNPMTNEIWEQMGEECTVLTMYFVEDALAKIRPLIERHLLGKKCKIITIGYAMEKWEPKWCEVVLGLTVHMYDMENLDDLYNKIAEENIANDISAADIDLNIKSKEILASQQESNPFTEQRDKARSANGVSEQDWSSIDPLEDFDEEDLAYDEKFFEHEEKK